MAKDKIIREVEYDYDLFDVTRKFIPIEKERQIYKVMKKVFGADPLDKIDHMMYKRGGYRQQKRKKEYADAGRQIAIERGIPSYNRAMGIPLGQRALEPYLISGTDVMVDFNDLQHVNNCAIQQMADDIKRTVILNLDVPHGVLTMRAGKEVTPESVNLYLETLQHTLAGGAVAQEHMAEINPQLTKDAYAKVITGDDEMKDMIDRRFVIDIDKNFHPTRAEILKDKIGSSMYLVVRVPTIAVRMGDGGCVYRWAAMQSTMAFVATYRMTGESVISDLAFAAKSAQLIQMGERTWYSRARSQNEPGGWPYGFIADFGQAETHLPAIPYQVILSEDLEEAKKYSYAMAENAGAIGAVLTDQYWLSFYMSGGIGFSTTVASTAYCGNVLEEFSDMIATIFWKYSKYKDLIKPKWETVRWILDMVIQYMMETYEKFPALCEYHWGGAHRVSLIGDMSASIVSMMTGSTIMGIQAMHYAIGLLLKEGWLRTGWAGQEVQDHAGTPYACSLRIEEGVLPELRGLNYPISSYTAGHAAGYVGASIAAAVGRGAAYSTSPVVKVAFSDPDLVFDFRHPRKAIAKAALGQFEPAGERDILYK
jgi:methyl-coenzyme M reductase alpha subunit